MRRRLLILITTMMTVSLLMGLISVAAVSAGHKKEGCTPGYWKNHTDNWPAPYTPSTTFNSIFDDAFDPTGTQHTLLHVLQQGGGGLNALGRHTVAALLNSVSIDYEYGSSSVISMFNAQYPNGDYSGLKDDFEEANERDCTNPSPNDR